MVPKPFISYVREDAEVARRLRDDLARLGAEPWLDIIDLIAGQDWAMAIAQALRASTHVLVLTSPNSVTKTGYYQREVRDAIELFKERPPSEIFLIPVRINHAVPYHEDLTRLHWVDLTPNYEVGLFNIARALGIKPASRPRRRLRFRRLRGLFKKTRDGSMNSPIDNLRRKVFEQVVTPAFGALLPIAREYFTLYADASVGLERAASAEDPVTEVRRLLNNVIKQRAENLETRVRLIELMQLLQRDDNDGTYDDEIARFAGAVGEFFYGPRESTAISGLIGILHTVIHMLEDRLDTAGVEEINRAAHQLSNLQVDMENGWREVTRQFATLQREYL